MQRRDQKRPSPGRRHAHTPIGALGQMHAAARLRAVHEHEAGGGEDLDLRPGRLPAERDRRLQGDRADRPVAVAGVAAPGSDKRRARRRRGGGRRGRRHMPRDVRRARRPGGCAGRRARRAGGLLRARGRCGAAGCWRALAFTATAGDRGCDEREQGRGACARPTCAGKAQRMSGARRAYWLQRGKAIGSTGWWRALARGAAAARAAAGARRGCRPLSPRSAPCPEPASRRARRRRRAR